MYIDYNDMIDKLNNQEGAMVFGYSTMIPVMNQHHSNLNMGMFVPPFAYNQSKNIVYLDFQLVLFHLGKVKILMWSKKS